MRSPRPPRAINSRSPIPAASEAPVLRESKQPAAHKDWQRALTLIRGILAIAAPRDFVADLRTELADAGVLEALKSGQSAPIYDWLMRILSFQGISDRAAGHYLDRHGSAQFADVEASLNRNPSCEKLKSAWSFHGCGYAKGAQTCANPALLPTCPLPRLPLRNGRLNQMAFHLFLFLRDICGNDVPQWIDTRLAMVAPGKIDHRLAVLLEPMRAIHGISDKMLSLALSGLLLGSGRAHWSAAGARLIVVDTLIHNFLHRTGIQQTLGRPHPYGPLCYAEDGCADSLARLSASIDARIHHPRNPVDFPRLIQLAIWRFCATDIWSICNGRSIDDRFPCPGTHCPVSSHCAKLALNPGPPA